MPNFLVLNHNAEGVATVTNIIVIDGDECVLQIEGDVSTSQRIGSTRDINGEWHPPQE